ncbi:MAG: 2-oxoglutarate dehydrogenase complex dihydrolipoyllysine-residue succinyltransferase [Bacteroidota bacterium]
MAEWFVNDGDQVDKNQEIGEVESDKATLPLIAEATGAIEIKVEAGSTVKVGDVVATIDPDKTGNKPEEKEGPEETTEKKKSAEEEKAEVKEKPGQAEKPSEERPSKEASEKAKETEKEAVHKDVKVTPVARKMMEENHLNVDDIINGLRRIGKDEVSAVLNRGAFVSDQPKEKSRDESRERMSSLRRKLSQRMVAVKNETAMLTTFNEVDMAQVINLRKKYQKQFTEKHGVKLGFMSVFIKAATVALQAFPKVNSRIDGEEVVTPEFVDVGIAVQTQKGLMVPIIRNTESLSLPKIETALAELAQKARKNRISIEEMSGGTFSITNGGVFGSLMSTPLLNPPQSAILGMHNIVERPVALDGKVEIRPMMYLALSYDHRIIDGKDSVTFLVKIKELIENPTSMLFGDKNGESLLLDL